MFSSDKHHFLHTCSLYSLQSFLRPRTLHAVIIYLSPKTLNTTQIRKYSGYRSTFHLHINHVCLHFIWKLWSFRPSVYNTLLCKLSFCLKILYNFTRASKKSQKWLILQILHIYSLFIDQSSSIWYDL